jgi:hypothetical protein
MHCAITLEDMPAVVVIQDVAFNTLKGAVCQLHGDAQLFTEEALSA